MNSIPLWVTIVGFAAPLLGLAGSAIAYVINVYQETATRRRNQFFELMRFIDSKEPIAAKVAAVYELRQFHEHRDFIIRFCETQRENVSGPAAQTLIAEMDHTRKAMLALPPTKNQN